MLTSDLDVIETVRLQNCFRVTPHGSRRTRMLWIEPCIVDMTDTTDMTGFVKEPQEAPVLARIIAPLIGRSTFSMILLDFELFGRPKDCGASDFSEKVGQAWN